jgi:hypothetical protein
MLEVKSRSPESWGPLASMGEREFKSLIGKPYAKDAIKTYLKKAKKLKDYKVTFKKEWHSDTFILKAESDWDIGAVARQYFKDNLGSIGFHERERGKWAGDYAGYDSISYVKMRS